MRTTFTPVFGKVGTSTAKRERAVRKSEPAKKVKKQFSAFGNFEKKVERILRRIKRTKITVVRTETVFLRMQDVAAGTEYARALLEQNPPDLEQAEIGSVLEIEADIKETDIQGEVK